nr:PH, RCC1 and FYVE domains-containing protein 1 [Tanacetum cinerariifolium]
MGERFLFSSDRALDQAIVALKKGAYILKYGPRGKPKLCPFRLSTDEKTLMWFSGKDEKHLHLSSVTSIIRGHQTRKVQPERESHSFSLIYMTNQAQCSLDLMCKDKVQADSWFLGLKALISKCQNNEQLKNQKRAQSCVNSPTSFIRRKYNLGFPKESIKISQVRSICGSPIPSLSDRCFSEGLSFSSDSLYSRSSLSSVHNLTDGLVPSSPCVKHEEVKNISKMELSAKSKKPKLNDVLIWGEGVELGVDALLPKVLDSVSMLDVDKITLAGKHAVLVTKRGEVFCWGEGKSGRGGHNVRCPKEVETLDSVHVKSVSCSEYQTCALTVSGEVYTWGDNCSGQSSRWVPRRISGVLDGITVSKVACGEWHTAIVSDSGQLFTFGDGTFGVLGHGNCQSLSEPKQVESLRGMRVKSIACGTWHTAAVVRILKSSTPAGKLFTWGDGDKGRLGHGNSETKDKPTCVMQLVDHEFVQVSCARMLTVGLTTTGVVYTIGSSVYGQLGNPNASENSITLVQGKLEFEFVREIASGSYHVAVLTSKGSVYTWGKGANGQLGVGDTEDRNSPTLVETLSQRQVESVSCGPSSTAVVCVHESITCGMDQLACRGCNMEFGFMKKKHSCYNCGLLFCSICSGNKSRNACLAPDETKSFRVCDSCYKKLERSSSSTGDKNHGISGSSSLLMNRVPRWGQVSSPASFRKHGKEESSSNNPSKQKACQQSVEPTVKRKGAKDAIKALTSKLQSMSPRAFMRKQAKAHVDTPTRARQLMYSSTHGTCDIETSDINNSCNATPVPVLHTSHGVNTSPSDELVVRSTLTEHVKQIQEWMEQYRPGVYITFVMLPTGRKGIKRVRFSKKFFREREAERWWEDNQQEVYKYYNVDGYINSV